MINLRDCKTTDILPLVLKKDAYVQSSGHALRETARMLLNKIDKACVYAVLDIMPDEIVDLLAEEFRAQYYDTSMPVEEKRKAVKKALLWHCRAGTVSAVRELTNFVWRSESAKVQEWFEYGSDPYLFRILLGTNMSIEEDLIDAFLDAVWKVKNTRSHLESITFMRNLDNILYVGGATRSWGNLVIIDAWQGKYDMYSNAYAHTARSAVKRIRIKEEQNGGI